MWDISSRLGVRLSRRRGTSDIEALAFDDRFVWNEHVIRSLLDFRARLDPDERADLDVCQFLVRSSTLRESSILDLKDPIKILAIQGYVGIFTMALPAPPTDGAPTIATLSLISRLGWRRAGTRFNTRGVDDDGNCANFAEAGPSSNALHSIHHPVDGDNFQHRPALCQLRASSWHSSPYVP